MNTSVDFYFSKAKKWHEEIAEMRTIVLECQLVEELKWGCPCYTFGGNNIVLIHTFKEYCAFLFFKGVLLKDPKGILIQQTEQVQAARQIRFTDVTEIKKLRKTLKAYVFEAVKVEESGQKVLMKKTTEYKIPEEFEQKLKEDSKLKTAFEALTPGRQRGYLLHFGQAKQSKTRISRIENCMQDILDGKGLND